MKTIFFSIAASFFLFAHNGSKAQTKLNHIAIYVENLEKSTNFYKEVIGLQQIEEPFKDDLHAWFKLGESQLHLIQGKWQATTINKHNHLCFSVPDMEAFLITLKENDIDFEDWPKLELPPSVSMEWSRFISGTRMATGLK